MVENMGKIKLIHIIIALFLVLGSIMVIYLIMENMIIEPKYF